MRPSSELGNRPLSTLFIDITGRGGGSNESLRVLLGAIDRRRFKPTLIFCDEFEPATWSPDMPVVIRLAGLHNYDFFPASWKPAWVYHVLKFVVRFPLDFAKSLAALRRYKPQLVHLNGGQLLSFGIAARFSRCCVVWHVRELVVRNWIGRLQDRLFARCADRVIAVSSAVTARIPSCAPKVVIVPNGVSMNDPTLDEIEQVRKAWGVSEGDFVLLLLSRFVSTAKGYAFLASVAKEFIAEERVKFVLAGRDPHADDEWLKAQLRKGSGLIERDEQRLIRTSWSALVQSGRALFAGDLPPGPAIVASSVVVCPNQVPEPFGRTVIEAMSLGRPAIASQLPAFDELIEHGVTGWLLPLSVHAWVDCIRTLQGSPSLVSDVGKRCRARSSGYTAASHAARIMQIFDDAFQARRQGA